MVAANDIRSELARLLQNQISLSEFSNWFVPLAWNIHLDAEVNEATKALAESIDDLLVEFDGDSQELRQALMEAWFASQEPSFFANSYGDASQVQSAESNAEHESTEPAVA